MSEWISIYETKPDALEVVLVKFATGKVRLAYIGLGQSNFTDATNGYPLKLPDYWKRLPESPKRLTPFSAWLQNMTNGKACGYSVDDLESAWNSAVEWARNNP